MAVARASGTARVVLISGGAGFGKTFLAKSICDEFDKTGQEYVLCAPTGKAAARLREATSRPTATVHRSLKYNGSQYLADPEEFSSKAVLCDESSMLDSHILCEMVKRNPRKLILIGDQAQLCPVGRGQPYKDLLDLRPDLAIDLKHSYRANEAVFSAAQTIRAGGRPPTYLHTPGESWSMENTGDPARTQRIILEYVNADAFDFEQDVILVCRNGESDADPCTVRGLNRAIVDAISPRDWADSKKRWRTGDRVINTHNLPALDVWNGTTGTVHTIDQDGGIWVRTDIPVIDWGKTRDADKPVYTSHVLFARENRKHLQLAYALTVHKAQGSQYRNVLMACFTRDLHCILDRSLLYTAVTRTKSACAVVGELGAAWAAIDKVDQKRTVMQQIAEGETF